MTTGMERIMLRHGSGIASISTELVYVVNVAAVVARCFLLAVHHRRRSSETDVSVMPKWGAHIGIDNRPAYLRHIPAMTD